MIFQELEAVGAATTVIYTMDATLYCLMLMTSVRAGQNLQNSWTTLKTSLAKLQTVLITYPDITENKAIHDLVRMVHLEPLQAQLMTMPLKMSLIPAAVSMVVTYIIVLLQLKKVI
ncbi:unnamed protein product [Diatraea saccharalis]|uniref:Gustatory receptor n=1 Tax=Diatraea saccharalis TaxID=40085 RepID=A0A9N9W8C0_9NEOP|nr:unnamed protein product [Diatraea saccharalis]